VLRSVNPYLGVIRRIAASPAFYAMYSTMSSNDNALWQQCWREQQTGFHQKEVNRLLARFWHGLDLAPGSRVFVPLCGKSLDMIWLAQQGYEVIGLELSPVAVRGFFRENQLQASQRKAGQFILLQSDNTSILCGDYFAASSDDLGHIDVVYDRAALTALPEEIRRLYVAHLKEMLHPACKVFLLTVEDADEGETREVTLGASAEITALYSKEFEIELAHVESVLEPAAYHVDGIAKYSEHKVYRLIPR
jgi:thiopurine S-methyltransferase